MSVQSNHGSSSTIFNDNIQQALQRSEHELVRLVSFYHQQGYQERAQEIYQAVVGIRKERSKGPFDAN